MLNRKGTLLDPHVKQVMEWRESLVKLPDKHFFELIRMYLGEVRTPYNKQKLVEELGGFLHKPEVQKNIVLLLDEMDVQVISAVWNIDGVTQDNLVDFFKGTYSFSVLYERLLNLEERLILYRRLDKNGDCSAIGVNPLFSDILQPHVSIEKLLPVAKCVQSTEIKTLRFTPQLAGAFLSYMAAHPELCKSDGTFKKRTVSDISEIFPGYEKFLQNLVTVFRNLLLIKENDTGYFIDYQRFELFAALPPDMQYAYICTSLCGHFSRDGLRKQAQLLLDCVATVPDSGYTRAVLVRAGYLIVAKAYGNDETTSIPGSGRFNRIVQKFSAGPENTTTTTSESKIDMIERLIESALDFGFLSESGKTEDGEFILKVVRENDCSPLQKDSLLSIDAGFSITLLPGLTLAELLPLTRFIDIVRFDTAAQYEISRKSIMRAFDAGITTEQILTELKKYTSYDIPQNFRVSVDEWYHSYTSAVIYKGYILQVDVDNSMLTEKNPLLSPYISKKLAPGIYLLNISDDAQATELIGKSGLDFIGSIQTVKPSVSVTGFPLLRAGKKYSDMVNRYSDEDSDATTSLPGSAEAITDYLSDLRNTVDSMKLEGDRREGLEARIKRKIILSREQLRADSVHAETIEARGMDFLGKIHVIERAISSGSMIKLVFEASEGESSGSQIEFLGKPLEIKKHESDAIVTVRLEPDQSVRLFSIGQAASVRRIRGSIFSELSSES